MKIADTWSGVHVRKLRRQMQTQGLIHATLARMFQDMIVATDEQRSPESRMAALDQAKIGLEKLRAWLATNPEE
jgi:hypothetical protein